MSDFYLPDGCWEFVLRSLKEDGDYNRRCFDDFDVSVEGNNCLKSLSAVSKQLLSITNNLRFSLTVRIQTLPFLPRLLLRFTNLTYLDLKRFSKHGDLDALLRKIARFPLKKLTTLNISNQLHFPAKGLRAFSKRITTLTSLISYGIITLKTSDLFLIANCFPLLEELDLSAPCISSDLIDGDGIKALSDSLFQLRKIDLSAHHHLDDQSLFHLFKNCKLLQQVIIFNCYHITNEGIASALRQRPTLTSLSFSDDFPNNQTFTSCFIDSLLCLKSLTCLNLSFFSVSDNLLSSIASEGLPLTKLVLPNCTGYGYDGIFYLLSKCKCIQHLNLQDAHFLNDQHVVDLSLLLGNLLSINLSKCSMLTHLSLFALVRNCPSLSEIKLNYTSIGKQCVENSNSLLDFVVKPQLKSLYLAHNSCLRDENLIMFASIFPNLQLIDLSYCDNISDNSIFQVLNRWSKIRHLNLAHCSRVKLYGMNIRVLKLEVLSLIDTRVDDEALHVISKSCCGLLQLLLQNCEGITETGVKHVLKNCTQLREIN